MMEDRAGGGLETLRYCLGVAEQREWKPWLLALLMKEEEDLNPRKLWCVCVCVCVCVGSDEKDVEWSAAVCLCN